MVGNHQETTRLLLHTSAGPIDYVDVGAGPAVLLLHGMHMTGSVWREVVAELRNDHRVVVPTFPLGGQRRPLPAVADASVTGMSRLLPEILAKLDLDRVTVVGNDTGGALIQLSLAELAGRASGVVLVACEAFANFPPGLDGHRPPERPSAPALTAGPSLRSAVETVLRNRPNGTASARGRSRE